MKMFQVLLVSATYFFSVSSNSCSLPTFRNTLVTFSTVETGSIDKLISECITPLTLKKDGLNYNDTKLFQIQIIGQEIPIINARAVADFPCKMVINFDRNNVNVVKSKAFLNLPRVAEINLQRNSISTIEVGVFDGFPSLKSIRINNNQVRSLELQTFRELPELEEVFMFGNRLVYFEQEWFGNTPKLTKIDISFNEIRTVARASFVRLPSLRNLRMRSNQIEHVHKNAFDGLKNLTRLDLGHNRLTTFHVDFDSSPLQYLLLDANKLTYFSKSLLEDFRFSIQQLKLYGNPIQCSCYDEIVKWSRGIRIDDPFKECAQLNGTVCVYPENDEEVCNEDVSDDLAQELNDIFAASYKTGLCVIY